MKNNAVVPIPGPPLKWAGGKRWLVPKLQALLGPHLADGARLVEPFVGGLSVALGLNPRHAFLNDSNPHPINLYTHIARGLTIERPMRNERELYYQYREEFNNLTETDVGRSSKASAELFYYLNRTAFNGLCRFNKKGKFNVPFGRHTSITYRRDFQQYVPVLSRWRFVNGDFNQVDIQEGDVVYADPPYDLSFTNYSGAPFEWQDQIRLAHWLASLKVPVIASNQASDRILELYADLGFDFELCDAPRAISRNGDRTPALEMFATKGFG